MMAVDVHPVPLADVPPQAYASRLYSADDLAAIIELLQQEPVLLGDSSVETERKARYRAGVLRRMLAEYDVAVTTRTWPEFTAGAVVWRWCVVMKDRAND